MDRINRTALSERLHAETERFATLHPGSAAQARNSAGHLLTGNGMNWWRMWPGGFPLCIAEGKGAEVRDVDGNVLVDLCLGDTGAMTGHAPEAATEAIAASLRKGSSFMLPTEDHLWVAQELERRFGFSHWQFALSASDANRFAIRWARFATGRNKVAIFNHAYHGAVDETLAELDASGAVVAKDGNIGYGTPLSDTTRVVEFNDLEGAKAALADEEVAIFLVEPALTNMSIVLPEPGFLEALSEACRERGTLFLMDETHTISEGYGGYTGTHGIRADIIVIGKPIASGIPAAVYGFTTETARRIEARYPSPEEADALGIGTTLTGSAVTLAAIRATLEHVLSEDAHRYMNELAILYEDGLKTLFSDLGLNWSIIRMGARVEFLYDDTIPRNGSDVLKSFKDHDLNSYLHVALLNRGFLLTPFHNMALMCPATTKAQVESFHAAFRAVLEPVVNPA